jgi:hypothetical protein
MDGDADGDLDVDGTDFLVWQREFTGGSGAPASVAVPEPSCLWLFSLAVLLPWSRRPG